MFEIEAMPNSTKELFRITKGTATQRSVVGHEEVVADSLPHGEANDLKMALNRAYHIGAVSLLVQPGFEDEETGEMIPQAFGPDQNTRFWCLYHRSTIGGCEMINDYPTFAAANTAAITIAKGLGIEIEVGPWEPVQHKA